MTNLFKSNTCNITCSKVFYYFEILLVVSNDINHIGWFTYVSCKIYIPLLELDSTGTRLGVTKFLIPDQLATPLGFFGNVLIRLHK